MQDKIKKLHYAAIWHTTPLPLPKILIFDCMNEYLEKLSAERCSDMELSNAVNVAQSIFDKSDAIDEKRLFMTRFCRVPNWITLKLQCKSKYFERCLKTTKFRIGRLRETQC